VIDVIGLAFRKGVDPAGEVAGIRDNNLYLQSERIQALMTAGFPYDYLDDDSLCKKCGDTGYLDSEICSCLMELYREEQRAALSNLFKLGNETFDNFDLSLYDDSPDQRPTARDKMEIVYDTCLDYARKFERKKTSLYLSGATGLGKTFLSACIARVVSDKGFSVVYDMATSIFSKFEEQKFDKSEDISATRDEGPFPPSLRPGVVLK
jgi:DNA replication protein DnaC